MTFEVYKELLSLTLSHNYKIDSYYLGEQYDLVGISQKNEDFETKEICLVSLNRTESYVKNEIEKLPEISLSGMRNFLKNKKSTILRVFVLNEISYELIKFVQSYKFSYSEKKQFWAYAEVQIVLVDIKNNITYSNLAAKNKKKQFLFTTK